MTLRTKEQKVIALCSAEVEFRGIAKGLTEILWLQKLLEELGFHQTKPCKLYCDNEAAISISENPVQHDRTKHVEVDRNFIKEKLENKVVSFHPSHPRTRSQIFLRRQLKQKSLKRHFVSWVFKI